MPTTRTTATRPLHPPSILTVPSLPSTESRRVFSLEPYPLTRLFRSVRVSPCQLVRLQTSPGAGFAQYPISSFLNSRAPPQTITGDRKHDVWGKRLAVRIK